MKRYTYDHTYHSHLDAAIVSDLDTPQQLASQTHYATTAPQRSTRPMTKHVPQKNIQQKFRKINKNTTRLLNSDGDSV